MAFSGSVCAEYVESDRCRLGHVRSVQDEWDSICVGYEGLDLCRISGVRSVQNKSG